jgi:hypothetical protein
MVKSKSKLNKIVKERFYNLCESNLDWDEFLISLEEIRRDVKDLSRDDVKFLKDELKKKILERNFELQK